MELPALEDPWHEAEPTEIYERMRHLEMLCCKTPQSFRPFYGIRMSTPSSAGVYYNLNSVRSGELMHPKAPVPEEQRFCDPSCAQAKEHG